MKKTSKELSDLQEARIAEDIGGRTMPASGSRWGGRRDAKSDDWLVEAKTTSQGYYRLICRDLQFLQRQAYQQGRTPAYVVEFQNEGMVALLPRDVLEDEPPVLVDVINQKTWSFTYQDASLPAPPAIRFPCGCYILIPYERFLQIVEDFVR